MSLSCHNSSALDDIALSVCPHTPLTRLIIIFSDITFTLRVLLWRRDDASVWDFDIWHERRCHDQIFIYKICSFQADYILAFIKIYHCEAFTLYIRHCRTFVTITGHWTSSGYSPGYYHSLWLYTNVTNNKSELWPICDTINFPIRSRSQWRYIPSNDSCPHYIISLNTAPPFLSQCAHTP